MKARIRGSSTPLHGSITINGSKNAALPIIAASLLTPDPILLHNIPNILDVRVMVDILLSLGAVTDFLFNTNHHHPGNHSLRIQMKNPPIGSIPLETGNKLRASINTVGPLLARFGSAPLPIVGGCNIGRRSVDFHLEALQKMGANLSATTREIFTSKNRKLKGTVIHLPKPSVGATENVLMAATLAEGVTILTNAALEPDVTDLAHFLVAMGAKIEGIGTRTLRIQGVNDLHGCEYSIIPDRHEAGAYALAAIITGGILELRGIRKSDLAAISRELSQAGGRIFDNPGNNSVTVRKRPGSKIMATDLVTNPFPNFPTDMQAPFCTLLALAQAHNGSARSLGKENCIFSVVQENIFDNRFQHAAQLNLMGADIVTRSFVVGGSKKTCLVIRGVKSGFVGNTVAATDLRAAAALVLAGLVANGETIIENIEFLLRGFEGMDKKLNACGADIVIYDVGVDQV